MKKELRVRALCTSQGKKIKVYSFFIPGQELINIADISRIYRDEEAKLHGFQRKEILKHVNNIVEYLDQKNVLFPNAITLALSPEIKFKQARGASPEGLTDVAQMGTLHIPLLEEGHRSAWIVDGQQRSLALSRTKNKKIPVPVVGFVAKNLDMQREQFILVNKAKPLPTRLINELLPEVDTHLPRDLAARKIPSELCNLMNLDPKSPFHLLIRRASQEGTKKAVIVDTALIEIIKTSISSPLGALSQFKSLGNEPSRIQEMYKTLMLFWGAVKEVFPEAWGKTPQKSRLMHSAGIKAMGVLMDRVMTRAQSRTNPKEEVKKSLERIASHCCWTEGVWEDLGLEWNEVQNVSRHVKGLAEQLIRFDYDASFRNKK
jgi:DGQHR domain-containing protein